MLVTPSEDLRVYNIEENGLHSTMGFSFVFDIVYGISERFGEPRPTEDQKGSVELYNRYIQFLAMVNTTGIDLGTWYHHKTKPEVKSKLQRLIDTGYNIRLWYGSEETGLVWLEEDETIGHVSRSMGPIKVPLLVGSGLSGGSPIRDQSVVRIMKVDTNYDIYRHRKFHLPEMRICSIEGKRSNRWMVEVLDPTNEKTYVYSSHKEYHQACDMISWHHGSGYRNPGSW